jgi:hypothetical protein
MTVDKARAQEAKQSGASALQTYLTSLVYLRQEAKRDGLDAVAGIMWDALAAIERWLDTGNAPAHSPDILDSSLCHSLDFLLKLAGVAPGPAAAGRARHRQIRGRIKRRSRAALTATR